MSKQDGKTFAGTMAALSKQTVSGNLWNKFEQSYSPNADACLDILSDLKEYCKGLNVATIRLMADGCHKLVKSMCENCMSLINSVENEEENASLPQEKLLEKISPPMGDLF